VSLLEIKDLQVNYGEIQALKGVSLTVEEGEVVAMLGANGAGKTTLLRTISGLLRPKQGTIRYRNHDLTRIPAYEIVTLGVTHSPEGRKIFGTLTVRENLVMGGYTRPPAEIQESIGYVYRLFPRLEERRNQLAGTLSGGEQQMLTIGRALIAKPKLLLLDEPSLGIAPVIVQGIFRTLREISQSGVTILLVEQNARMALRLADRGYVLEVGKVVLTDTARKLLNSSDIQQAYLGKHS
jgi:branched-chain amino acid transport system ATP-binding protein